MNKVICVYSSSSNSLHSAYFDAATVLGREIARRGDTLLYGGGTTGLMGACARAVHQQPGRVIGVIPEALNEKGIVYEHCDELIVTDTMRERKAIMDSHSDAFIALPGGFGTIEEIMEIITLKQLGYHQKPIVVLNINGCYTHLLAQLDLLVREQFAKPACLGLFFVTDDPAKSLNYIDRYSPTVHERWLTDVEPTSSDVRPEAASFDFCKLEVYIPQSHLPVLQDALQKADAGHIGPYDSCLSYWETTGCWRPLPGSNPYDGDVNVLTSTPELKVEVLCRRENVDKTIFAIKSVHPYEVPVINAVPLYRTGL